MAVQCSPELMLAALALIVTLAAWHELEFMTRRL